MLKNSFADLFFVEDSDTSWGSCPICSMIEEELTQQQLNLEMSLEKLPTAAEKGVLLSPAVTKMDDIC